MKAAIQKIVDDPKHARLIHWGKLISLTGGAQAIVQGTGLLCGIMIVRLLSLEEYALYTLANTMLGTMTMLADSGISNGVMAQGGKVWQDPKKLGVVMATGLDLRKKFAIASLIISIPILFYLLIHHNASWWMAILIVLALIPAFFAALSDSILEMVPKLHQDIKPLQTNGIIVSVFRLFLSGLSLLVFPFTFIAVLANSIPRIYGNMKLRKMAYKFAESGQQPDAAVNKEIIKGVKRTLPIVFYHCISGQITLWLISIFGTTTSISQIGALGRLSMLFSFVAGLFSTLVIPRFSRMPEEKGPLLSRFISIQLVALVLSALVLFLIWLFADQILWVFGSNYSGLHTELVLVGIGGSVDLMCGICSGLVISRGWFMKPYFLIGVNFFSMLIAIAFFDISSLVGILYFQIIVTVIAYFLPLVYGLLRIFKKAND